MYFIDIAINCLAYLFFNFLEEDGISIDSPPFNFYHDKSGHVH